MNRRPSHTERAFVWSIILAGCALLWAALIGFLVHRFGFTGGIGAAALIGAAVLTGVGIVTKEKP